MGRIGKLAAAVAILALAVVLYVARSGGEAVVSRSDFDAKLECAACGQQYLVKLESQDVPPYACVKCGKKAAWRLKQCRKCEAVFLPPLEGEPPRQPMMATCPKCGSQATGAVRLGSSATPGSPG